MDRFRLVPIFVVVATLSLAASSLAGQSKATTTSQLTPAEMETFLQKARIMGKKDAGAGVTGSLRVTLSDGKLTHDAHVQFVDITKPVFEAGQHTELNFKDSYRFNIAGYRLAQLLEINTVPMSVERKRSPDEEDDGTGPTADVESDPVDAHLGRTDSEPRP